MSATPKRFNDLLDQATDRVKWPTSIDPQDVRDSGLIKDEIVLWHTKSNGRSEWAMLKKAAERLKTFEEEWDSFAHQSGAGSVRPILLVQVTDGLGKKPSKTDLGEALSEIEGVLGTLSPESIGHCFQDQGSVDAGAGRVFRKLAPSEIQDDESIRVVFFKMALNTGWDCPRAEVMMSFRSASDYTYIAQLVGRMVRTPMAERIIGNEFLNSVALFLPNWNDQALNQVIDYLTKSDHGVPSRVERGEDLKTYDLQSGSSNLVEAARLLPTYPSRRANKDSNVKRLLQLSRYLANDEIHPEALDAAKKVALGTLHKNRRRLKSEMAGLVQAVQSADLQQTRFAIGMPPSDTLTPGNEEGQSSESPSSTIEKLKIVKLDVHSLFSDSGRRLGGGLHIDYVRSRVSGRQATSGTVARAELCALVRDKATQDQLEQVSGDLVRTWWLEYHAERQALSPERQAAYARVNRMASSPEAESLNLPKSITLRAGNHLWKHHLYVDSSGDYFPFPVLNRWEQLVLSAELERKDFKAWHRNPVRKDWSLGIPYEKAGTPAVMYPDFLVFRSVGKKGVIIDLLEPHAENQEDLCPKLLGLCRFADNHGDQFGRIELIMVEGPHGNEEILRLDVNDHDVRAKAKLSTQNAQVTALAKDLAH